MEKHIPESDKLKSFDGQEFNSWKRKVLYGMQYDRVFYTIQSDFATTKKAVDQDQWDEDDYFCKTYLLNCLSNNLADTYSRCRTAKEVWDSLEAQFQKQDDLSKSHLVDKFDNFRFQADKDIMPQLIDFENLRSRLFNEDIRMCDQLFVGIVISRLPATWHNFKTEMYRNKVQVGLGELK